MVFPRPALIQSLLTRPPGERPQVPSWPGGDPARRFEVRHFAGPSAYVSAFGRPLRVVHLTDQHVGWVTPMAVQEAAIRLTNEADPDLVMITGDFVAHSQKYLGALQGLLSHVHAPIFAVLGNHDHWVGAREVRRALRLAGVEVLDNAHTIVRIHGERLQIVGLDDAYTGHAYRHKATRGMRRDIPAIGLSHIAEEADGLWANGVSLVLAGHTHAGQITVGGLHELALGRVVGHKYVHGLYGTRLGETPGAVYVGAGVGAAMMPLRLGERARREVTIFELGARPSRLDEQREAQEPLPGREPSRRTKAKRVQQVEAKYARRERREARRERREARHDGAPWRSPRRPEAHDTEATRSAPRSSIESAPREVDVDGHRG